MDNLDLKRLLERLRDLEKKVEQNHAHVMLEETSTIAEEKEWGGKSYFQQTDGGIIKHVRIPVCDICGRSSDQFSSCSQCKKKLCSDCSIIYLNRVFCIECLQELVPLTKQEYKILMAIFYGIRDNNSISNITKIDQGEVSLYKRNLKEKGFITIKGFLLFTETQLLEKGIEALYVYDKVYGKDDDVAVLESELRRFVFEKN
jgi:hypothetical protein